MVSSSCRKITQPCTFNSPTPSTPSTQNLNLAARVFRILSPGKRLDKLKQGSLTGSGVFSLTSSNEGALTNTHFSHLSGIHSMTCANLRGHNWRKQLNSSRIHSHKCRRAD